VAWTKWLTRCPPATTSQTRKKDLVLVPTTQKQCQAMQDFDSAQLQELETREVQKCLVLEPTTHVLAEMQRHTGKHYADLAQENDHH